MILSQTMWGKGAEDQETKRLKVKGRQKKGWITKMVALYREGQLGERYLGPWAREV